MHAPGVDMAMQDELGANLAQGRGKSVGIDEHGGRAGILPAHGMVEHHDAAIAVMTEVLERVA